MANCKNQNWDQRYPILSVNRVKQKCQARRNCQAYYYNHIYYASIVNYPTKKI